LRPGGADVSWEFIAGLLVGLLAGTTLWAFADLACEGLRVLS
jgi:F0F1-type ATP synthase assembly protein I